MGVTNSNESGFLKEILNYYKEAPMTRSTKRTPELIKEVGHFYYDQKLSIKKVAQRLNIGRTMTLEILNQNLDGSRKPKEAAKLRIEKYGNPKFTPLQLDHLRDRIRVRGFKEEWKKQISQKIAAKVINEQN